MSKKRFCCMICDEWCLKPYNGLCKQCQKKEITGYRGKEE